VTDAVSDRRAEASSIERFTSTRVRRAPSTDVGTAEELELMKDIMGPEIDRAFVAGLSGRDFNGRAMLLDGDTLAGEEAKSYAHV
jgi:hypothetical protein